MQTQSGALLSFFSNFQHNTDNRSTLLYSFTTDTVSVAGSILKLFNIFTAQMYKYLEM